MTPIRLPVLNYCKVHLVNAHLTKCTVHLANAHLIKALTMTLVSE